MADRWIAPCVCGCLILQAEAPRSFAGSGRTGPWAAGETICVYCVCACVSVCVWQCVRVLWPHRSWLLSSLVWSPTQCLPSLCLYLCVSPSISLSPPLLLLLTPILFSHQHSVLFCFGPTFLISPFHPSLRIFFPVIFSICHLAQQGLFSLPISLVFFFFTPLHFRAEILQSFTRLLDSSLPDFLLCSSLPCFTGLWRMPLECSPSLSSFLHFFFTQWSQPSFAFIADQSLNALTKTGNS